MANLNKVLLIGNLTRDIELRTTPKGTAIAQFGLAINRTYQKEDGSKGEEVTWVDIEAWGKQAETLAKYLTKGSPLYLEGRLKLDQWEDKATQQKRSKMKVVLENFQFLGAPKNGSSAPGSETDSSSRAAPRNASSAPRAAVPAGHSEQLDEDVPF